MNPTPLPPRCPTHRSRRTRGCQRCQTRDAAMSRRRNRAIAAGSWERLTDAAPVRAHLHTLAAAGTRRVDLATRSGISVGHLGNIMSGHIRTLTPTTAAALLALTPMTGRRWLVDATGTRRKIRALAANGWPRAHIAARLGIDESGPRDWVANTHVTRATADKVDALYHELAGLLGPSQICRRRAAAKGWPTPDDWYGLDIDNPATPTPTITPPPDPNHVDTTAVDRAINNPTNAPPLTRAETDAAIATLLQAGWYVGTIARHLHVGAERIARIANNRKGP